MTDIRTILCAVDFSEPSRAAMTQAEDLAKALEAELVLTHIVAPAFYPVAFGAAPMGPDNVEERAKEAAEEALQAAVTEITGRGVRCSSLVGSGSPAERLVSMVGENDIDLVVMATHGFTGLKHALMGSVAERVVRTCPCPVLTVKATG
jgi:universal stress protein A